MDETAVNRKNGWQSTPRTNEISTLRRREIQSPLVASMLRVLVQEFGYEKALEVASRAIEQDAILSGIKMAEQFKGNGIKEMVRILTELWAEEEALEYTILEQSDQRFSFDITRCRFAELYERLGIKEFGCVLSCSRDGPFIASFNPRMKLFRTQTIMQGASVCDFRIVLEEGKEHPGE